jgi:hypothetical protein
MNERNAVQRYDGFDFDPQGAFVLFEDYEAMRERAEAAEKALEEIKGILDTEKESAEIDARISQRFADENARLRRKGEELCRAYGNLLLAAQWAVMQWRKGDNVAGPMRELEQVAFRGDEMQGERINPVFHREGPGPGRSDEG